MGKLKAPALDFIRLAFNLIGLGLVGVAFFPVETEPLLSALHLISAWGMAAFAVSLMVTMPLLLIHKDLLWLHRSSMVAAGICIGIFAGWQLISHGDPRQFALVEIFFGIFTILWLLSVQITTSYFIHTQVTEIVEVAKAARTLPPAAAAYTATGVLPIKGSMTVR
jgi:hypothetical protein